MMLHQPSQALHQTCSAAQLPCHRYQEQLLSHPIRVQQTNPQSLGADNIVLESVSLWYVLPLTVSFQSVQINIFSSAGLHIIENN
jgi:hypothetical protein